MAGTMLVDTRASMYRTPDFESEIRPVIEAHKDEGSDEYPMAIEDLISANFKDADYLETARIRGVLISAAKADPTAVVAVWFQPGYKGSKPPTNNDGTPKYPRWAEEALAAGAAVQFVKERYKRRQFGAPKALALNSDLSQKLGDTPMKSETKLQLYEAHQSLARAPAKTIEAVCRTEAALGGEIKERAIIMQAQQHRVTKAEDRTDQLFSQVQDLLRSLGQLQRESQDQRQLIAELQEQVQNLGGTPLFQPSATAAPVTAVTRQ